jgi:hypothetical protein
MAHTAFRAAQAQGGENAALGSLSRVTATRSVALPGRI